MARVTYGLVVLGAVMRLLQYPGAFVPLFYQIGSFMGVPVVFALVLFMLNLVRTLRPKAARPVLFAATLPARG